jgi:toxin ParE1/3/4
MNQWFSLTSAAEFELAEHAAYLGKDNADVGERFLLAATETFEDLLNSPGMGEVFRTKKAALSGVRIWRVRGFPNHVIAYRSTSEGILVLRIFHAAQNWQGRLQRGNR